MVGKACMLLTTTCNEMSVVRAGAPASLNNFFEVTLPGRILSAQQMTTTDVARRKADVATGWKLFFG
jgi:hypothetical protein